MTPPTLNRRFAQLSESATGYWRSAAILAALELGIFEHLTSGARSAEQLANALPAAQPALEDLLRALVAMGLLRKSHGRYSIRAEWSSLLRADAPTSILDALRLNRDFYDVWRELPRAIGSGQPVVPPDRHLGRDPERTRRFVMAMHSRAKALAPSFIKMIRCPRRGLLLDLGSGSGAFSLEFAERNPRIEVVQYDLAPVLEIARTLAADSPAVSRIRFHPGDYHRDPLPGPVDAVLFCGALHQEDRGAAASLFTRIHAAVRPGGYLTVIDLMFDPTGTGPLFAALFSLNMRLFRPNAGVWHVTDVVDLLRQTGWRDIVHRNIPALPYRAVTARRD